MTDLRDLATSDTHNADGSAIYSKQFLGILNHHGGFWTQLAFDSRDAAKRHFDAFWGEKADGLWPQYRVVPVRVRLDQLAGGDDD